MSNQWKRNAVVATVLLFVCAAVYLNWRYAGDVANGNDAATTGTQTLANDSQNQGDGNDGIARSGTLRRGAPPDADRI